MSELWNDQQRKSFCRGSHFFQVTDKTEWFHLSLTFKPTSALLQLHVIEICCINHKVMPLNYHFCCLLAALLKLQNQTPNIIFLKCKLQWLPLLLLQSTLHFPPKHSISWRNEKMLPFRATYEDLTTVQYAHFAAASPLSPFPPALLFNKQCLLTVGFHLALLSVTSSRMVSQLTGAAQLLCCDNIHLM